MPRRQAFNGVALLMSALMAVVAVAQTAATSKPSTPPQLCLQSAGNTTCTTAGAVATAAAAPTTPTTPTSSPANAAAMKWHPGNYVRANIQGFAVEQAARFDVYEKIRNEPLVKGALVIVNWGSVEKSEGVYDFSIIDKELARMKSMGKRLILEVWWHKFAGKTLPSTPQNTDRLYLPDYVIAQGGAAVSTVSEGYMARLHDAKWMNRLIALYQALGARYDADPFIEQIIVSETSLALADPTFNQAALNVQFKRLVPAIRAAWPTTSAVMLMNWISEPGAMLSFSAANGVGTGGPDIVPPPPDGPYEDYGSQALRGAGGSFGSTDYRGRIPVSYQSQVPIYAGYSMLPATLYRYAYNTLKATHLTWTVYEGESAEHDWASGVLPAIRASGGVVRSACPTAYLNGCSAL
jgi:hypothetical protein